MMHLLSPNHSKEALYMFHNLLVAAYKHRGREGDLQRAINHCNAALALEEQGIRWTTLRIQGGILGNTLTNDILECVSSRVRHIAEGQCQLRCQPSLAYFNPINTKGDDGETSRPKALIQMLQLEPHKDDTFLPEAVYQTRLWLFWTMYVYDAKRALYYGWCSDVDPYATLPPLPSLRRLSMIDPLVSPNTTNQPRKGKRPLSQVLQEYDPSSWRGDIDNSNNDNNNSSSDNSNYKVSGTKDLKIELTSFDMSWIDQYQSVSAVIQPPPISTLNEMLLLQSMEPFKWPMDRDQAAAMRDPAIELVAYDRHMTRMIHWIEEDGDLTDGGTFSRIIFGFEARLWMIGRRVARYIARKRARRCRTAMGSDGVVAAAGSAAGTATSTMKRPAGVCRTACRPQLRPRTSTQSTASSSSSSTSIETRWTTDARWSQSAWASDDELQSIQAELVQWEQELPDPFRFRKDHHYPDVNHEVNGKMGQLVLYYYTIMLILHSSYLPIPASWNAEKRFRRCRRMMQSPTSSSPSEQPSSQSSLQESASSFFLSDDSDSPSPPPHASSPNAAPVASSANGNSNSNSEASCANQPQSCLPPPILSQLNGTGKLFSGEDKVSEVSDCTNIVDVPVTEVGSPSCSPSNMSPQLQHQPPQQQQQQSSSSLYFTTAHKQCTELAITLLHHIDQLLTRYPQWVRHDTHIENSIIIAVRVHLVNSKLGGLSRQDGVQGEGSTATTTLTDLSGVESAAGSAPAVSAADPMTTEPVVRDRFQELRREATSGFRLGSELSRKLKALRHPLEQLASSPSHGQAVVRSKDSTAAPNSAPIVTTTAIATTATPTEMSSAAPYANLMAESCQEEAKREHIDKGDEGGEGNSDECMKEIEDLRQRVHRMWSTKIRHYSRGRFKTTMEFSSTSSCSSTSRSQPKQEQEQQQEKQEQEQEQRQEPGQAPQLPERAAPGMIPGMSNANAESIGQVEQQLMTDPSLVSTSEDCPDCLSGMCLVHGTVEGEQPDHQMMRQLFPTDFSIEDYLMLGMDLENLDFDLDL
ncbi:hypothetical protein BGZ73_000751 [Actinomortierella ambigua]|nr:hypothetical protein BGZ73_000751 [Actinomortierella ambigua]